MAYNGKLDIEKPGVHFEVCTELCTKLQTGPDIILERVYLSITYATSQLLRTSIIDLFSPLPISSHCLPIKLEPIRVWH